MSSKFYKATYEEPGPFGSKTEKEIYAWHNDTVDIITVYDSDGSILFSFEDTEGKNMMEAIMSVCFPNLHRQNVTPISRKVIRKVQAIGANKANNHNIMSEQTSPTPQPEKAFAVYVKNSNAAIQIFAQQMIQIGFPVADPPILGTFVGWDDCRYQSWSQHLPYCFPGNITKENTFDLYDQDWIEHAKKVLEEMKKTETPES